METIRVRTTQNVFIEYPIASLGDRIIAFFIDAIILTVYQIICYFILDKLDMKWNTTANVLAYTLPFLLYHPLFEIFMNGQSPGKLIMRIKVVSMDGSSPTIGAYVMRWLFRFVEILMLRGALAMVTIAANGKGQRLGDLAAGTAVVKLISQQATTASEVFTLVEDEYQPVYNEVLELTDFDIELMQQALTSSRDSGNPNPVNQLAEKVKSFLGVQSEMPPVKFLYTIIKDYSFLTSQK